MGHGRLGPLLYLFLDCVQAKVWKSGSGGNSNLKAIQVNEALEPQSISPTLKPESSKTFFKKDYPYDKRPPVSRLHFGYPYPVVQDSGDYDKDYIKDENSDNGEFHAQSEYDRLRHKLTEDKKQAKQALAGYEKEEQELKDLLKQYNRALARAKSAEARKYAAEEEAERKRKEGKETPEEGWDWWRWEWWPWNWTWGKSEKPVEPEPSDGVAEASADTEKKMSELEECEKQLAETRERLKKLMDDLEKARAREGESEKALDEARRRETEAEKRHRLAEEAATKEKEDHLSAEAAYLKQKEIVDKLEKELQLKADKVRKHRRKEDADGGVYPTKVKKSAGMPAACASATMLLVAFGLQTL